LKYLKVLIKVFVFIIGALISLWLLMPWGKIGEYAVLSAEKMVSSRGMITRGLTVQHSSVSGTWRGPTIGINDFSAKMNLGGGEFKKISFSPSFMQSIIQLSPVASVSFTGGKLLLPGGNETDMGRGKVDVSYKKGILSLKNFKSEGELAFDGFIVLDVNNNDIVNGDLMIKAPEKIESSLDLAKTLMRSLNQESTGQWRIKKEKSNG
jgi:hypothetical protein